MRRTFLIRQVAQLDEGVGNITAALRRKGDAFWSNTLVVLTTDNGGPVCLNMSTHSQRVERATRDCGTNNSIASTAQHSTAQHSIA